MKKKILRVMFIILGILAAIILVFTIFISRGLSIKDDIIQNIDISKVPDGVYQGKYSGNRFANELQVTVVDGKISNIVIVKDMIIAIPDLSAKLFDEIRAEQSLQVDTVSGATVSTKAYLKAVEDALDEK